MKQAICPLDKRPCERGCPDRDKSKPAGGCWLVDAAQMGAKIIDLGGGNAAVVFVPNNRSQRFSGPGCDC